MEIRMEIQLGPRWRHLCLHISIRYRVHILISHPLPGECSLPLLPSGESLFWGDLSKQTFSLVLRWISSTSTRSPGLCANTTSLFVGGGGCGGAEFLKK
jgi:hypothetical protein